MKHVEKIGGQSRIEEKMEGNISSNGQSNHFGGQYTWHNSYTPGTVFNFPSNGQLLDQKQQEPGGWQQQQPGQLQNLPYSNVSNFQSFGQRPNELYHLCQGQHYQQSILTANQLQQQSSQISAAFPAQYFQQQQVTRQPNTAWNQDQSSYVHQFQLTSQLSIQQQQHQYNPHEGSNQKFNTNLHPANLYSRSEPYPYFAQQNNVTMAKHQHELPAAVNQSTTEAVINVPNQPLIQPHETLCIERPIERKIPVNSPNQFQYMPEQLQSNNQHHEKVENDHEYTDFKPEPVLARQSPRRSPNSRTDPTATYNESPGATPTSLEPRIIEITSEEDSVVHITHDDVRNDLCYSEINEILPLIIEFISRFKRGVIKEVKARIFIMAHRVVQEFQGQPQLSSDALKRVKVFLMDTFLPLMASYGIPNNIKNYKPNRILDAYKILLNESTGVMDETNESEKQTMKGTPRKVAEEIIEEDAQPMKRRKTDTSADKKETESSLIPELDRSEDELSNNSVERMENVEPRAKRKRGNQTETSDEDLPPPGRPALQENEEVEMSRKRKKSTSTSKCSEM
ncbi:hypothetical protein ACOME3_003950 [Neoechinorhynchus agilis]